MLFLILAVVATATSVHSEVASDLPNVVKAKSAACIPELKVVQLAENNNASLSYFPSCTRVKRCGGCCEHLPERTSCQPTATKMVNYEIRVTEVNLAGQQQGNVYKKIVPVEEHTACGCQCIKKAKDCTDKQFFVQEECTCRCKDSNAKNLCQEDNLKKYWDPNTCSCQCRKVQECSTNFDWDEDSCMCKPNSEYGRRKNHRKN